MSRYSVGRARGVRTLLTAAIVAVALAVPGVAVSPQSTQVHLPLTASAAPGVDVLASNDWCPELRDDDGTSDVRKYPPNPAGPGSGLPELPCEPDLRGSPINTWADMGVRTDAASTVDRAKLEVRLPVQTLRTYLAACFYVGRWVNPHCAPIAEERGWTPPTAFIPFNGQAADAWVESPPGAPLQFGTFQPVRVRTVAFGNIPVVATAHITQTVTDGLVDPLAFQWLQSTTAVGAGIVIPGHEDLGPSPGGSSSFAFESVIEGPVRIRLSDVSVDGVPVDVGPSCRTSTTTLSLRNPPGWFSYREYRENPETVAPGKPGAFWGTSYSRGVATIGGTIDIPPFRGCGVGAEDLDPLVTALVSGPDNPVQATSAFAADEPPVGGGAAVQPWCDAGLSTNDQECPIEDYDEWDIDPAVHAARVAGSADPFTQIPQWVREKLTPRDLREIRRFLRLSH